MVSRAGIDPPLLNFGEIQTTRDETSETTLAFRARLTTAVRSTCWV